VKTLDDFADISSWQPIASGHAELRLSRDQGQRGDALRLDFDFKGGGGFVVVRKPFSLSLPDAYSFGFDIRAVAPANNLEFKLVDPSGKNVWRYQWKGYDFPTAWRSELIRSRELEFAWGPAGGGSMAEVGVIELVIAAGPGGQGTVWFEDLRYEDRGVRSQPVVQASSSVPGHEASAVLDGLPHTSWRPAPGAQQQWLVIDFQQEREYGGLVIDWEPAAAPRSFEVETSDDGTAWNGVYSSALTAASRNYVFLPGGDTRRLRLVVRGGAGVTGVEVKPFAFSRSIDDFFHGIAAAEPRGRYPKYWCREQTYWTPVGVMDGVTRALLNEEGMVEVDEGSFSIEPFLFREGRLISWADVSVTPELEDGYLPVPSSTWQCDDLVLRTTAFATRPRSDLPAVLYLRYHIENAGERLVSLRVLLAVRPFQVTPPWQKFRHLGGVSPIRSIVCAADRLLIDGRKTVVWDEPPAAVGAACFDENIGEVLAAGEVPGRGDVRDGFGCASAALRYDFELAPGVRREFQLAVPFDEGRGVESSVEGSSGNTPLPSFFDGGDSQLEATTRDWREKLCVPEIQLPEPHGAVIDTLKTAAAHILINRDGPALQPGPRRYTRSWIRDGAIMGASLLRMGCDAEMRDFIRWYAPHQRDDGFVPCCIDRGGVDWLVEHDSHGQLVYAVMEYYRFSGDQAFLAEMWPMAIKAIDCIEALRNTRLTAEFQTPEKRACYGLLPESASHEGYLAHPVHSYWDDFWALRGLKDGARMAEVLGETAQAKRIAALRDALAETLYASIRTTIAERGIDYIPGSVEWADFDPTATSNAIAMLDQAANLPTGPLEHMYDEYLRGFRDKHSGRIDWNNYTAYEIRIVGALVRLGKRQSALELLDFFLSDTRPRAWNQWPEITWRDPKSPGHQGDLPHTWIGAEYILSVLGMFAFEREADRALVIGAGLRSEWLDDGGVRVRGLRTWYGKLDFTMERDADDRLRVVLGGDLRVPPGGIVLRPPREQPLRSVRADGMPARPDAPDEVRIDQIPCEVVIG
jgi:hypothetical protein